MFVLPGYWKDDVAKAQILCRVDLTFFAQNQVSKSLFLIIPFQSIYWGEFNLRKVWPCLFHQKRYLGKSNFSHWASCSSIYTKSAFQRHFIHYQFTNSRLFSMESVYKCHLLLVIKHLAWNIFFVVDDLAI